MVARDSSPGSARRTAATSLRRLPLGGGPDHTSVTWPELLPVHAPQMRVASSREISIWQSSAISTSVRSYRFPAIILYLPPLVGVLLGVLVGVLEPLLGVFDMVMRVS